MPKLLVVVGATGLQGRSALQWFQQHEPSWKLRGTTRNSSSKAAVALAETGIEINQADFADVNSLKTAFRGATAIFAYTDFGGILKSDEVMGRFMRGELSPPLGRPAFDIEVQHGKNIADAAAAVPELERLVFSTLNAVKEKSSGKYASVYHFDAKAVIQEYMLSLPGLEGKVSTVLMAMFYSNPVTMTAEFGLAKQADGSVTWDFIFPKDLPLPWVDIESDTGAFVKALIEAPADTHLLGASDEMSLTQWAELFGKIKGTKAVYSETPWQKFVEDDPIGFKNTMKELIQFLTEFGYEGQKLQTPDELEKKGFHIPRTSMANYINRADWTPLLD